MILLFAKRRNNGRYVPVFCVEDLGPSHRLRYEPERKKFRSAFCVPFLVLSRGYNEILRCDIFKLSLLLAFGSWVVLRHSLFLFCWVCHAFFVHATRNSSTPLFVECRDFYIPNSKFPTAQEFPPRFRDVFKHQFHCCCCCAGRTKSARILYYYLLLCYC